jgi:T5SS/PEP-CTERM-associated repeat protein
MALAVTVGVANATYHSNMFTPAEELINAANPANPGLWTAGEEVRVGSSNFINGPGTWDGNMRVDATAAPIMSGRLYVGGPGALNSGRLIIDGASWTGSSVLHLGQNASNGAGGDELSVLEIINGGSLNVQGTEMGQTGGGRLLVDGIGSSFSTGSGHFSGNGGAGNTFVTISGGATAGAGFTNLGLDPGTGTSTLNVDGAGSVYSGAAFYLGNGGRSAFVNVTGGGRANADNFFCAHAAGGLCDVTISGSGSLITGTHNLNLGQFGTATLTLEEGGMFMHNGVAGDAGRDVDIASAATLIFGIGNGSKIATTADAIIADGATIGVKFDSGFLPVVGQAYDLLTADGTLTVNPGALVLNDMTGPNWTPTLGTGSLTVTFVPEPATMILMAFGGLLMAGCRRRG